MPGGIRVIPSVASPWPDVPVYVEPNTIAQIKTGDEFSIGLDVSLMLGASWTVDFDMSVLSLVADETVTFDPGQRLGTHWFRFKAIAEDYSFTNITCNLIGLDGDIITRLQFGINVIE